MLYHIICSCIRGSVLKRQENLACISECFCECQKVFACTESYCAFGNLLQHCPQNHVKISLQEKNALKVSLSLYFLETFKKSWNSHDIFDFFKTILKLKLIHLRCVICCIDDVVAFQSNCRKNNFHTWLQMSGHFPSVYYTTPFEGDNIIWIIGVSILRCEYLRCQYFEGDNIIWIIGVSQPSFSRNWFQGFPCFPSFVLSFWVTL